MTGIWPLNLFLNLYLSILSDRNPSFYYGFANYLWGERGESKSQRETGWIEEERREKKKEGEKGEVKGGEVEKEKGEGGREGGMKRKERSVERIRDRRRSERRRDRVS